jgi:hypothetical protein
VAVAAEVAVAEVIGKDHDEVRLAGAVCGLSNSERRKPTAQDEQEAGERARCS